MKSKAKTIWLAGGGTGGHISPAISMYEFLKTSGHDCIFFSLEKNREYPSIKNMDTEKNRIVFYKASPIPGSLKSIIGFLKDLKFSFHIFSKESRENRPDAILAFGGYPVFPVLLWALIHSIPYYMHEQNARHGVITRLFSVKARKIFLSFPKSTYLPKEILTGNPLRKIFLDYKKPKKNVLPEKGGRRFLLLGGSQGASDINSLYLEMIQDPLFKKDIITISTGKIDYDRIREFSRKNRRKQDQIYSFIEDIPTALMSNDYIVSRSGSGMIFEILWSGKPACFIPYPYAASDHQKYNSLAIENSFKYVTIDVRPFNSTAALSLFLKFIEKFEKTKTGAVKTADSIPLNAHKLIADILIQDLK